METGLLFTALGSAAWAIYAQWNNRLLLGKINQEQEEMKELRKAVEPPGLNEARLMAVQESIADMTTILNQDGVILAMFTRAGFHSVVPDQRVVGQSVNLVYDPVVAARYIQAMEQALLTGRMQSFTYESEYKSRAYGREVRLSACGEEIIVIEHDMTERLALAKQLRYLGQYDSLTGLLNRRRFAEELRRLKEEKVFPVGAVVCDLDGLKLINDTLGYEQGDKLLVTAAGMLQHCFRPQDCIARIGGDEFAVLLPNVQLDTIATICTQLAETVEEYNSTLPSVHLGFAIGFAISERTSDLEALFVEADNDMVQKKLLRSGNGHQAILEGMLQLAQTRDYFASAHPERMEAYAILLAERLNLSEERIANLRLLARFHDIGKAGLEENLIMKPGRLTASELREVSRHSELGCRIVRVIPQLAPIAELILKHHEWWDGSGYPLGLTADAIPLECRILALVDAYEVMTAGRPYRPARSCEEAMEELRQGAGSQFDPELVSQFLQLLCFEATGREG